MADYQLQIITQEKTVFDRRVVSLVAPGGLGYLGILAHHAPLLTTLSKGSLSVKESPGREYTFSIDGGFLEFSANTATILADSLKGVSAPEGEALLGAEETEES